MRKILIIEDDIFLGDVLMKKVRSAGFEALLVRDGKSGLAKVGEWKPDIVLLDIILPVMNGYEVLEMKNADPEIAPIPVIVISNSGQPVEINRALALGVKDYLVKADFDPDDVLIKVQRQLGEGAPSRAEQERRAPSEADAARGTGVPQTGTGLSGKKIMWVEDDAFLGDIIARKLGAQGCVLVHARDGETAFKKLKSEKPDLILLDILLPGIGGFDVLKEVKQNPALRDIPVILLSNLGQKEDIERGKQAGAARFLIKATVTLDEIVEEIRAVLQEGAKPPS